MIGFLKGTVDAVTLDNCLLDVQGVGYQVGITRRTSGEIHIGMDVKLYTYLAVREDDMSLYGFFHIGELETFKILISVSGIGAKVAIGILSDIGVDELAIAISQKNIGRLTKISGIGKKTAERMLLELKDKIGIDLTNEAGIDYTEVQESPSTSPIIEVLRSLGYQMQEISKVVSKINFENMSESEAVKLALKELSKGR